MNIGDRVMVVDDLFAKDNGGNGPRVGDFGTVVNFDGGYTRVDVAGRGTNRGSWWPFFNSELKLAPEPIDEWAGELELL